MRHLVSLCATGAGLGPAVDWAGGCCVHAACASRHVYLCPGLPISRRKGTPTGQCTRTLPTGLHRIIDDVPSAADRASLHDDRPVLVDATVSGYIHSDGSCTDRVGTSGKLNTGGSNSSGAQWGAPNCAARQSAPACTKHSTGIDQSPVHEPSPSRAADTTRPV